MISSYRVLAVVGILALASAGCGKGSQSGEREGQKEPESRSTVSKSGDMKSKSGKKSGAKRAESKTESTPRPSERIGVLTAEDNGRDLEFRQGQLITVVLDANRPTGMSWALREPSGNVIVREGNPVYTSKAGKRGSSGTETWHFRAARPGSQSVRLEYRRKFAQNVPDRTFGFSATVR